MNGICLLVLVATLVPAQEEPWAVGIKVAEPFCIKTDGEWSGISVDLWEEIAKEADITFAYEETSLADMFPAIQNGDLAAAVGALTITSEREEICDFTYPFYHTGLAIAVSSDSTGGLMAFVRRLLSPNFVKILLLLAVVLFGAGAVLWIFERRRNAEQFGGTPAQGLGAAFWWAAVTMTTVGYGDKAPRTGGGRVIALLWMFVSLIVISGFLAAITSTLTVSQMDARIRGVEDLAHVKTGAARGSTSEAYLMDRGFPSVPFADLGSTLDALAEGEVDAVVHDAPILQYLIRQKGMASVTVLPYRLSAQDYAFAIGPDHPDRETINRVLLRILGSDRWEEIVREYLGE